MLKFVKRHADPASTPPTECPTRPLSAQVCPFPGTPVPANGQTCTSKQADLRVLRAPRPHPNGHLADNRQAPRPTADGNPSSRAERHTPLPDGNKTQPQQETPRPARKQEQTQSPGKKPEKANRATPEPQKYPKSLRHPTPVTEKNSIFAPDTADLDRDLSHPSISTTPTKTTTN